MRFVYGNDYGDLAGRQLATDAAIGNRYFQSLSAIEAMNRLHQAEATREAQLEQRAQEMLLQDQRQREMNALNNQSRMAAVNASYLTGMQKLADMKPYYDALAEKALRPPDTTAQDTRMELFNRSLKEQQAAAAAEEEQTYRQAQALADLRNRQASYNELMSGVLPSEERFRKSTGFHLTEPEGNLPWTWTPLYNRKAPITEAFLNMDTLNPREESEYFDPAPFTARQRMEAELGSIPSGEAYPSILQRYRAALALKMKDLSDEMKGMEKSGIGNYIQQDQTGRWIPNLTTRFYRPEGGGVTITVPSTTTRSMPVALPPAPASSPTLPRRVRQTRTGIEYVQLPDGSYVPATR